ncbi:hypothetical protein Q0590_36965 [Rhodocytophaga aerolata]|uniref:Uncharacterized protein n=1 Tax=Rhodocytophaga aerolata TaxID=455078 RepID=A0ABT8RIK9_9BACT|nr:hypothetical protein [Rhodocytophaga aerolata]MDO1451920.1 hypothetical protein [Rhodocytophaga aerolata]
MCALGIGDSQAIAAGSNPGQVLGGGAARPKIAVRGHPTRDTRLDVSIGGSLTGWRPGR